MFVAKIRIFMFVLIKFLCMNLWHKGIVSSMYDDSEVIVSNASIGLDLFFVPIRTLKKNFPLDFISIDSN